MEYYSRGDQGECFRKKVFIWSYRVRMRFHGARTLLASIVISKLLIGVGGKAEKAGLTIPLLFVLRKGWSVCTDEATG